MAARFSGNHFNCPAAGGITSNGAIKTAVKVTEMGPTTTMMLFVETSCTHIVFSLLVFNSVYNSIWLYTRPTTYIVGAQCSRFPAPCNQYNKTDTPFYHQITGLVFAHKHLYPEWRADDESNTPSSPHNTVHGGPGSLPETYVSREFQVIANQARSYTYRTSIPDIQLLFSLPGSPSPSFSAFCNNYNQLIAATEGAAFSILFLLTTHRMSKTSRGVSRLPSGLMSTNTPRI